MHPIWSELKPFSMRRGFAHQSVDGREALRSGPDARQLPADFLVVHLTILESLMQHTSLPPAGLHSAAAGVQSDRPLLSACRRHRTRRTDTRGASVRRWR